MEETTITTLPQYIEIKPYLIDLAKRASVLTAPDKDIQKELQKARKLVTDGGKFLRSDYRRMADEVMQAEKEHLAIIEAEEKRLKSLSDAIEAEKERLYRVSRFEERKGRMASLGMDVGLSYTDEINETLSDADFEKFYQSCVTSINEKKQAELEERERKVREEEERQARIKRDEEWAEKIRQEEADKAARAIKDAEERAQRAEQDAKEKAERDERARIAKEESDKLAKEQKEIEEKKKLEADIAYQLFLESHGYEKGVEFYMERDEKHVRLYKLVGTLELE